ncbi:MAG: Gldg family protein [Spirochaetales bacterium]|nr:Gldg family protein [Spirochaetales bacterium]
MKYGNREKWFRFLLFTAVLVLVNLVSGTLFFRLDLTENKTYSLSAASKNLVASLEEPLTIRVFLSENLPQPYNNLEQQMRDLLEEYALEGNRNFNYSLYLLDQEGTAVNEKGQNLRAMAEDYNIPAIQIQNVEQDEVKLQTAYMGMVLVQGDLVETIPALARETNLEYRITSIINKISRKTSTMLSMSENVKIDLLLSPALLGLSGDLESYGDQLKSLVNRMNSENFGRLEFSETDPSRLPAGELKGYGLNTISLRSGSQDSPTVTKAYAGVVVRYGSEAAGINLLNQSLFGYSMKAVDDLEDSINGIVERLIGVNQSIGYLSDHGTAALYSNPYAQQQVAAAANFNQLVSGDYTVKSVTLDSIPADVKTLIINGPKENFSDWELFQLDQFIMKGGSVAFFVDSHNEIIPSQQEMMYGQMPQYIPLETGLEKLIGHYGVEVEKSYVMDENCFVQQQRDNFGGVQETPIYFAPKIAMENINNNLPFMKNIKGLIVLGVSPLKITMEEGKGTAATVLFSSSEKAWNVSENINLYNPTTIYPPAMSDRKQSDLAVLLEGSLTSYYDGKPLPAPPVPEEGEEESSPALSLGSSDLTGEQGFVPSTQKGRLFVAGSSALLADNVIDSSGASPNSMMIQNIVDYLNGREDYAIMRSKGQGYNPLEEVDNATKTFLKGLNIVFLPVLVILAGLIMWFQWNGRKRKIAAMFSEEA